MPQSAQFESCYDTVWSFPLGQIGTPHTVSIGSGPPRVPETPQEPFRSLTPQRQTYAVACLFKIQASHIVCFKLLIGDIKHHRQPLGEQKRT